MIFKALTGAASARNCFISPCINRQFFSVTSSLDIAKLWTLFTFSEVWKYRCRCIPTFMLEPIRTLYLQLPQKYCSRVNHALIRYEHSCELVIVLHVAVRCNLPLSLQRTYWAAELSDAIEMVFNLTLLDYTGCNGGLWTSDYPLFSSSKPGSYQSTW